MRFSLDALPASVPPDARVIISRLRVILDKCSFGTGDFMHNNAQTCNMACSV
jgi:hypothetical protein